jgi:hypothetical protein
MRRYVLLSAAISCLLVAAGLASAQGDPKAIIERAIKAHGGEAKLNKLNATLAKGKGTMELMGQTVPFTSNAAGQLPDKLRNELGIELAGQKITILQILNGDKAWLSVQGQTQEMTGAMLDEMKETAYTARVESMTPLLKEPAFKLAPAAETSVNGKPALGVKVTSKGHKDVTLYFDKDKGLLVRSDRVSLDPGMAEVPTETIYSDFKDIEGVIQPLKIQIKQSGKPFINSEITEIKFADKLDDKLFEKP